ncbi:polysaccharide deacetylase family protein [Hamadaea tsunoensis]|uniref:polysaccharide deacetylase family protein n=1 Tax=Hamadaea tsunoensis TaxID=53368 RepID=UPI00040B383D|nr:polysaccharide deacetylase family protein [Hamadaea tsunoensis]
MTLRSFAPLRRAVTAAAVLLLAAGAAAGCKSTPTATPTLVPESSAAAPASPSPDDSPSPEPSPSDSPEPSVSPSPSVAPSKSAKPPATPGKAINCTGKATLSRAAAKGTGPGGSMMTTGSPAVALTFDDGPDPINTPKMLDMLKQCGVKATFCLVGFRARDRPDLVRRIVAEGHTVCNHSWQHLLDLADPAKHSDAQVRRDLQMTIDAIHAAAPDAKVQYFRAPGGNFTPRLVQIAQSLGMKSIYWSVDPRDWDNSAFGRGSSMISHVIGSVEGGVRPGAIVLSHDNGKPDTIVAYRTLLPWLKARFTLEALPLTDG